MQTHFASAIFIMKQYLNIMPDTGETSKEKEKRGIKYGENDEGICNAANRRGRMD